MNSIGNYMHNLIEEFYRHSYDFIAKCSKEEQLLYLYAYYHYFNADSSKILDIKSNITYQWDSLDHISGIFIDQDSDASDVDVLICQYCLEEDVFDFPQVLKMFKDTEHYFFMLKDNLKECRKAVADILTEEEYKCSVSKPLKIRYITNYSPNNIRSKQSFNNALNAIKPEHEFVNYSISFGVDIEYEILEIENPKEYVDEGVLIVDKANNFAHFGTEDSIIANVSARSIKGLYELYGYRGLFAQNLRYYIKNAKIDGNIVNCIHDAPQNFWYYNNGIILVCDEFRIFGTEITLEKFSIINGGQTTKLIGETDFTKDFYIQCKIVRNKYVDEVDRLEFIANVAEASNTQKPIKEKDLIANRIEQRLLKKQMAEARIYCQIKRGEKINKRLYPEAWQNTSNEEIGQFLLSFLYQKPGTARGSKASICGNTERYSLLFGKTYSSDLIKDILFMKAHYKMWVNNLKKNDDGEDMYKIGLANNGQFFMSAIIGVLCKLYYHPEYMSAVNTTLITEQKLEILSQCDISHGIFNHNCSNIKENLFHLFEYCYTKFYRPGYELLKSFKDKYNNYSNFTKINNNYTTYVLRQIFFEFQHGISAIDTHVINNVLHLATEEELACDRELLKRYVNVVAVDLERESSLPQGKVNEISEALTAYRARTFKLNRIKAYEVFKNAARDRIAKFAPETLEDLEALRCLDAAQLKLYGQDIVKIVSDVL